MKIFLGGFEGMLNDCKIIFVDEIFKIEKFGVYFFLFVDGKFLRWNDFECDLCGGDLDKKCYFCFCCVCGGKYEFNM